MTDATYKLSQKIGNIDTLKLLAPTMKNFEFANKLQSGYAKTVISLMEAQAKVEAHAKTENQETKKETETTEKNDEKASMTAENIEGFLKVSDYTGEMVETLYDGIKNDGIVVQEDGTKLPSSFVDDIPYRDCIKLLAKYMALFIASS